MMTKSNVAKFSNIIRSALESGMIHLDGAIFDFDSIHAFLGVRRDEKDFSKLTRSDFNSQMENDPRKYDVEDEDYYSCSCWDDRECMLKNVKKLSNIQKWKIAHGYMNSKNGAIRRENDSSHIHWYLFKDATPQEDFSLL